MKQEIIINLFEDGKFWNKSKLRREITLLMKEESTQKDHLISQSIIE